MCYLRMRYHYKNSVKVTLVKSWQVGSKKLAGWRWKVGRLLVETEKVGRLGVPPSIQKFIATLSFGGTFYWWVGPCSLNLYADGWDCVDLGWRQMTGILVSLWPLYGILNDGDFVVLWPLYGILYSLLDIWGVCCFFEAMDGATLVTRGSTEGTVTDWKVDSISLSPL